VFDARLISLVPVECALMRICQVLDARSNAINAASATKAANFPIRASHRH
jgi:hypothetical protein